MFETKALYQNDPLWKDEKLGHDKKETIGSWGCLLTAMTMVANGFGFDETPKTLNQKLRHQGGFQGALVIPAVLPTVCPGLKFKGFQPCENTPAPLAQIDAALAADLPVIVQVDWSPQPGLQTHWVVLYSKQGDDYLMLDPYRYSGDSQDKPLLLTERYKHSGKNPAKAISGVVWFEGPVSPATPPPQPKVKIAVPKDALRVYSNADGLALRAAPALSGDLIKRMALSAELTSLEEKSSAEKKVGVTNEWLQVQDPVGDQGFVAAWYVSTSLEPHAEEEPAPVTGDKGFVVRPTTDGLAMRTQPVISEATLIKRLPLSANLIVTESVESAKGKLGVSGQWLKVRDIAGAEGYVAAWYVTAVQNPALGVREDTPEFKPTLTGELVLRTTAEGVALRTQPWVADGTLIKRMPIGMELLVLETDGEARIGQFNQWLRVRDIEGDEGYVAAWYVVKRD